MIPEYPTPKMEAVSQGTDSVVVCGGGCVERGPQLPLSVFFLLTGGTGVGTPSSFDHEWQDGRG